jgi:hypothetical protein
LGTDPAKVRSYLAAELGKKAAELMTVSPDARTTREHGEDGTFTPSNQKGNDCPNGMSDRKEKNLRAILRAPELIQSLYRDNLVSPRGAILDERPIFLTALEKERPEERSAYLDEACAGDVRLRERIEALLWSHAEAGNFLRSPRVGRQSLARGFEK